MKTTTLQESHEAARWAANEFGKAQLGHKKRNERLVQLAEKAVLRPSGTLTGALEDATELEAAYRFLENKHVDHRKIGEAAWICCAQKSIPHPFVFVPVDGCSITITDEAGTKGYGPINTSKDGAAGVRAISAIGVDPNGVPIGMAGQILWTRSHRKQKRHRTTRLLHEKETANWLRVLTQVNRVYNSVGGAQRWFQLDAEGDFRELLCWAEETDQLLTVRAGQNRCVMGEEQLLLWQAMRAVPVSGLYALEVRGNCYRKKRIANMEVSYKSTIMRPYKAHKSGRMPVCLNSVLAREVGTTPDNEKPIEWLLHTNANVDNFEDALAVVFGYSQRWRIEEFHKAWKSVCGVERSQLHYTNFVVWATILSSVAMRIETMKYLSRENPEMPASDQFSQAELEAIVLLRKPNYDVSKSLTMGQVVRWVADIGGYTGKSSGGPPGTIVLSRGWARVEPAMIAISRLRENEKT